ncbi:hypothetical protein HYALB_00006379 [Hymenoscyphus albidus]|uniref:Uncharacterized protein n=1 Tax=Hymenoscyphus albidus TaxID=595503 RepID=A0A9N9LHH2_9HELO|nr:hypothetical protein HYALB_00006379 [Hymenoscyphus albidus]
MPSIAIVASYSYPDSFPENKPGLDSVLLACSIYASWEPVTLYLDIGRRSFDSPDFPSLVSYNHTATRPFDPGDFKLQNMFKPPSAGSKSILIDVDWANLMLPPNETIEVLRQAFNDNLPLGGDQVNISITAFSLLLVDALARIGMSTTMTLGSSEERPHNLEDWSLGFDEVAPFSSIDLQKSTEIVIELSRFGYSYSMRGTTRYISIGILLAYVTITLIHIVLILWFRWSCTDLGSLYDLVNLAFISSRSLPDEVVSFGLAELKKQNVNVRAEEQAHSKLRMAIDGFSG